MNSRWLDSDVLVYAKDELAPFGYAEFAGFWLMMERNIASGIIKITKRNYQEITEGRKGDDELAKWLKQQLRKSPSVCVAPSKEVQAVAARIGDYVYTNDRFYSRHRTRFSKGADAWIVAQAAVDKGVVVTRETSQPTSHDPKIPDLCIEFGVSTMTLAELMRSLGTVKK